MDNQGQQELVVLDTFEPAVAFDPANRDESRRRFSMFLVHADAGKGGIVCIGSGCYDWHTTVDASSDRYHKNVETMTMNAINYLMNK